MTIKHLQNKRSWKEILEALEKEYTISFKDICRMLKVSRNWVNQYIRPYVDSVYLPNGKTGGASWTKIASSQIGKDLKNESIWFNKGQFIELFNEHVSSVTKQTKVVPYTYFMTDEDAKIYVAEYIELKSDFKDKVENRASKKVIDEAYSKMKYCHEKYIPGIIYELIKDGSADATKRGKVEPISVDLPNINDHQKQLIAVHDIKDYGDSDEVIYRSLFRRGVIRIVLSIPNELGVVSEKIYYIEDPESIPFNGGEKVLLEERVWRSLK